MSHKSDREESFQKLTSLIKDIQFAMLTTKEPDGSLRSRPMATPQDRFDGELWFFTRRHSAKVDEFEDEPHVNVAYADPDKQVYVSISGRAELVQDPQKMEELWHPMYRAWFPEGLEDPEVALIKVEVDKAEYWDSSSSTMVLVAGFIKSMVTGKDHKPGNHEKLNL